MKKIFNFSLLTTALLITILAFSVQAQDALTNGNTYKEWIGENPNADTDITVVRDFLNSIVNGEIEKAKTLLADEYQELGPSATDTLSKENVINGWKENYLKHTNRKIGFVNVTFRALQGEAKGDWVTVWGNYSFTQNEKKIKLPFQYTAKVSNGKIINSVIYYDRLSIMQTLGFKLTPPE